MANHFWTKEENEYLLKHYKSLPGKHFAERFGVTTNAVSHRYIVLTRGNPGKERVYSKEMVQFIVDNWATMTTRQIADHIGVKKISVQMKLHDLRKNGYPLVTKKSGCHGLPVGTVVKNRIKQADGTWKYNPVSDDQRKRPKNGEGVYRKERAAKKAERQERPARVKVPKQPKPKPIKISSPAPKRAPKKSEVKMKTKVRDFTGMRLVQIDRKTWKYIKIPA